MNKAPDAFRTISEVAAELDLPQHVLRFWESRFPHIRPMKRGGGRRYYRPDDVELLRGVRHLLYGQGYTIRGVQRILREQGPRFVQTVWQEGAPQPGPPAEADLDEREEVGLAEHLDEPAGTASGAALAIGADAPAAEPGRSGPAPSAAVGSGPSAGHPVQSVDVEPATIMDIGASVGVVDDAASAPPAAAPPAVATEPAALREDWQGQAPASPPSRQLSPAERDLLQSALETLQSCRMLLDNAVSEAEQTP